MITKQQILQLLADTECHNVEPTTSKNDIDEFCRAICAFTNDLSGDERNGYLMIGAHDNGALFE